MASKLNALTNQLPGQQEPVNDDVMVEMSSQLESSVNMFDNMEEMLQQLDQSGNPDDQEINVATKQSDQDHQNQELVDETVAMETSSQLEASINTFDEALQFDDQQLDDNSVDQDSKNSVTFTIQQTDQHQKYDQDDMIAVGKHYESDQQHHQCDQDDMIAVDEHYEVQGVSVTFDTDSDNDDNDRVTIQVEEGGVVTNESWLYDDHHTESVTVTIATTDHTSKRVANYVTVTTPML